jgi:alpha-glucoside transport system substrate-binding protein
MRTVIARLARLLLALSLAAGAIACGGASPDRRVTILIPWDPKADSGEYNAFAAVINQFTQETGIRVTPQVTRGVSQQLEADLAAGDQPDVADFSGPGALYQFKEDLRPLQVSLRDYALPWRGLAMLGAGTVYAVPVKADVQSLIWYSTSAVRSPPATWAALQELSRQRGTPWCLGLASGAASGWPGANWIANILISRYQVGAYRDWLHGTLAWNSPQVSYAFQEWGRLLRYGTAVSGGGPGALITPFKKAMAPGRCILKYGALTATGLPSTVGYSYVRFPSVSGQASPALVSGDFMGLFTDNPGAKRLLTYLASPQAQALWVSQLSGDAFSADQAVPLTSYPQGVRRGIAGLLQPSAGTTLCFAAGDVMLPDVSTAFSQAVLDYVNNRNSLDDLLRGLQRTQQGVRSSLVWNLACSPPS